MPERVQLRRTKGWRMPPNTVKVDGSTRWGNPYFVEKQSGHRWNPETRKWEEMWELRHPDWLRGDIFPTKETASQMAVLRHACEVAPLLDLSALRGKNLACWCQPGQPCHADTLLELANEGEALMTRSFFDGLGKAVILAGLAWALVLTITLPAIGAGQ